MDKGRRRKKLFAKLFNEGALQSDGECPYFADGTEAHEGSREGRVLAKGSGVVGPESRRYTRERGRA
jgi:hypothetical protein